MESDTAKSVPKAGSATVVPVPLAACWICLDGVHTEEDPLLRGCACRGSSGFAHVSCATGYASRQSKTAKERREPRRIPWSTCPTCKQAYRGQMGIALAHAYWEEAQELPEQYYGHVCALEYLAGVYNIDGYHTRAFSYFEQLLDILRRTTIRSTRKEQSRALQGMASCSVATGDFEKGLALYEEAQLVIAEIEGEGAHIQRVISTLKGLLLNIDVGSNVEVATKMLKSSEKKHGREHENTLNHMAVLGQALAKSGNFPEAMSITKEAHDIAKRVFGADHSTTLIIDKVLCKIEEMQRRSTDSEANAHRKTATIVGLRNRPDLNGKVVEVLSQWK